MGGSVSGSCVQEARQSEPQQDSTYANSIPGKCDLWGVSLQGGPQGAGADWGGQGTCGETEGPTSQSREWSPHTFATTHPRVHLGLCILLLQIIPEQTITAEETRVPTGRLTT